MQARSTCHVFIGKSQVVHARQLKMLFQLKIIYFFIFDLLIVR